MGNKQNCGCNCCKNTLDKNNQKDKLDNTEVIQTLPPHSIDINKDIDDNIYEENPIKIVNESSRIDKPQILSFLGKSNKETISISNTEKDSKNILPENISTSKHQLLSSTASDESQFIKRREATNLRKKLIFTPEKSYFDEVLLKEKSQTNDNIALTKEFNKYSTDLSKSFSNYHFIKKKSNNIIQNNFNFHIQNEVKFEFIMYDQLLLKVAEGFQFNYIPRYCRITDKSFQYFKNEISAFKISKNPLISIPISLIEQVRIINFKPPLDKSHYFFEVFAPELQRMKKKLLPTDLRNEEESSNLPIGFSKLNKSVDCSTNKRSYNINDSHLMREVLPGFDQENLINEELKLKKQIVYKGIHFKARKELKNYTLFRREKMATFLNPFTVDLKKERKVSNSIKYDHNWTYREIDWYLGEKHFIFAVDNVKDLKKWVLLLNWFLSKNKSK